MDPDDIPQNVTFDSSDILGTGRFGNVYEGKLKATGQKVAVKIVQKEGKYKREIEVLKEFQELEHQHLVRLLDYEDKKNVMVITMEFCPFSDLSNYLKFRNITWKKYPLKESEIRNFFQQLIEGYYVLYRAKVIHRDLKPQNILLCQSGNEELTIYPPEKIILKIADFGISRFLNESGIALTVAGTPLYKAPEVNSQSYDYKVDLWSLGIIIIECLIGPKKFLEMSTTTSLWTFELFEPCLSTLMISRDLYDLLTGLLKRTPSNRIDFATLVKHKFLSMSTEFLEKFKKEAPNSNARAQNNVSMLHPQPSTSGMADYGSLAEEKNQHEMQEHFCFRRTLMQAFECLEKCKKEDHFCFERTLRQAFKCENCKKEGYFCFKHRIFQALECCGKCEKEDKPDKPDKYDFLRMVAEDLRKIGDTFVMHSLLSMSTEFLEKLKNEAPKSNTNAQNNVSILHPQPSASGMADSGPLEEEKIQKEMQVLKPFRCIDRGPCRMKPSGEFVCELCPMCHITLCEGREWSFLKDVSENLNTGVCKPFLLGNLWGPCDRLKLPGGTVVCQLCPICHTDHNSNDAQKNVSTLRPQPSTSGLDVCRQGRRETGVSGAIALSFLKKGGETAFNKYVSTLFPQPSTSGVHVFRPVGEERSSR